MLKKSKNRIKSTVHLFLSPIKIVVDDYILACFLAPDIFLVIFVKNLLMFSLFLTSVVSVVLPYEVVISVRVVDILRYRTDSKQNCE